jgi:hypothetical protein
MGSPDLEPQSAGAVLMVRPAHFAFNPQTAPSNAFQAVGAETAQSRVLALQEFEALARQLQRAGVEVIVGQDSASPVKPDAIFPNNWVSFHCDGTVVLYPLLAPNRRLERRDELLEQVAREGGFQISRTIDLTHRERDGQYLEGTGSLVLDRSNRVAYACLSPRTDLDVLGEFAQLLDYELAAFEAVDGAGKPVYHTNVLMAVGGGFAVICSATIRSAPQRAAVLQQLRAGGHEIVDISLPQMMRFAGNLLELAPPAGKLIALSQRAWDSLDAAQRRMLERHGDILAADIRNIERLGGGGVRCMLAEIHLPKQPSGLMS